MSEEIQVRKIKWRENVYLRLEDVQEMIRTVSATEGTDVKNRLEKLARNMNELKKGVR